MKYAPVHKKIVRGKRLHETTEERSAKTRLKKSSVESAINGGDQMTSKVELGRSLSVGMLAQAKKLALRRGVWFKTLNRVERGIIDLTVQCIDNIKSTKLAKLLTAIMDKLHFAMEGTFDRLVRTIGFPFAEKISCLAAGWGNVSAKNWATDLSFAAFLVAMHTSNDFM